MAWLNEKDLEHISNEAEKLHEISEIVDEYCNFVAQELDENSIADDLMFRVQEILLPPRDSYKLESCPSCRRSKDVSHQELDWYYCKYCGINFKPEIKGNGGN